MLFKAFFTIAGMPAYTEVPAGEGRNDAVLITPKYNYIVEFMADGKNSSEAMEQTVRKKYAELFTAEKKTLHLISIDFRSETNADSFLHASALRKR